MHRINVIKSHRLSIRDHRRNWRTLVTLNIVESLAASKVYGNSVVHFAIATEGCHIILSFPMEMHLNHWSLLYHGIYYCFVLALLNSTHGFPDTCKDVRC